jgi:hypothetical protein
MTPSTRPKSLLPSRAVGERYGGKHTRTISRWWRAGVIPPPDAVVHGRPYWAEETLDRHDRERAAEQIAEILRRQKPAPRALPLKAAGAGE